MNCNVKILGRRLYSPSKFGGYSLTRSCSVNFFFLFSIRLFVKFGWLDEHLDAVCGENTDKSIEKLTERLQAKNIIFPFSFSLQHLTLYKEMGNTLLCLHFTFCILTTVLN